MGRDRYPLESLLEVRTAEAETAHGALVEAEAALAAAVGAEAAARAALARVRERRAAARMPAGGRAGDLGASARWRDRLAGDERAAEEALRVGARATRRAAAARDDARAALADASGKVQATERHEEAWQRAERIAAERRAEREG